MTVGKIDTAPLKAFASHLPPESALRFVLGLDKDEVGVADFVARLPIYLALADKEFDS